MLDNLNVIVFVIGIFIAEISFSIMWITCQLKEIISILKRGNEK